MNGLIYAETPKQNIFEERFQQYIQIQHTITKILESMKYKIRNIEYQTSDPSHPTYSYTIEAVNEDKQEDGTDKIITLNIPIPDRNVSFVIDGIRWIPVFQIADLPIFKKSIRFATNHQMEVILQNTYGLLILDPLLSVYKVNKQFWPTFLLMVEVEQSYDIVLQKLNVEYTYESEKLDNGINIPICDETYINIRTDNLKIQHMLAPFITQTQELLEYEEKIMEYTTYEDTYDVLLSTWRADTKNKNVVKAMNILDNVMVPNGLFEGAFRTIDVLYFVLTTDYNLEERDINDIDMRRIRLGEWLLYKLAQQHKKNVLENTINVYNNAVVDVLATDQRRILDDSVNPLGELCMMSRVIYNGLGGIAKESCNPMLRNLHNSYFGKIDPMDTPTGDAVGVCQHIVPETILLNGKIFPTYLIENSN